MLSEEITKLRQKLDESVVKKESYKKIYKLSLELDDLIAKYYKNKLKNEEDNNIKK